MNWQPLDTLAEAVRFLEEQCGFLAVQVEIVPATWYVECRADHFSGTFTETELIRLASEEYARHVMHESEATASESAPCPELQPNRSLPPINSVKDAAGFLAEHCDLLAVPLEADPDHWRVVSLEGEFDAILTYTQLLDLARDERDMRSVLSAVSAKCEPQAVPAGEVPP